MTERIIYMDHAATSPLAPEVLGAMEPYFLESYGSASSIYSLGRRAREAVEYAREQVADLLGALPEEVYFTSGASESNNWAIHGVVQGRRAQGRHVVTTKIEHHSVLEPCHALERMGAADVTYLGVDATGMVRVEDLAGVVSAETVLAAVMHANNEVGSVEPVEAIGRVTHLQGVHFHVDAAQTVGHIAVDVNKMGCDSLSTSAHKMGGPKGCGALYVRKGSAMEPLIRGGKHEGNRRAGTHNVPGIVGFGKAAELASGRLRSDSVRVAVLRDSLLDEIVSRLRGVHLNGHPSCRLPGNLSICIDGVESGDVIRRLDAEGICVSSGSACNSGSADPSHVLTAMGMRAERAHGALRMTLGRGTTEADVRRVGEVLPQVVLELRERVRASAAS